MRQPKPFPTKRWLRNKPYDKPTSYDEEFARVGRQLQVPIHRYQRILDDLGIKDQHPLDLISVLLGYLEDQVSGIGLWRVFTKENQRLTGQYLPLFDQEDYLPDEVNLGDVQFLVWHFFSQISGEEYFAPDVKWMRSMAQDLYEVLIEAYEVVPETDFYETFLSMPADPDLYWAKGRLEWLVRMSYLFQLEHGAWLGEQAGRILKQNPLIYQKAGINAVLYSIQDSYLYQKRSALGALSMPEWLHRMTRGTDGPKAAILDLSRYTRGVFRFEGTQGDRRHFTLVRSGQTFRLPVSNFHLDETTKVGELLEFSVVPWCGQWYMSGLVATYTPKGEDDPWIKPNSAVPFSLLDAPHQAIVHERLALLESVFLARFGAHMVRFEANEHPRQAVHDVYAQYQQAVLERFPDGPFTDLDQLNLDELVDEADVIDEQGRTYLVFLAGAGVEYYPEVPGLLDLLRADTPPDEEGVQTLYWSLIGGNLPEVLAEHVLAEAPTHYLRMPAKTEVDWLNVRQWLRRYLAPEAFQPSTPNMTFLAEYLPAEDFDSK